MTAPARKAMFHFASPAIPAHAPIAIHQRGSRLASRRMTSSSVTAQNTKSGAVVVSSCITPRYSAPVADASAARSCPVRPAPSWRLIAAVAATSTARPSAGRIRSPTSVLPVSAEEIRASSGVSDGWSRSEEHTSELQSRRDLVCRLLLEKKKKKKIRLLSVNKKKKNKKK